MNKKIIIALISAGVVVIVVGIILIFSQGHIEDTNGTRMELVEVDILEAYENNKIKSKTLNKTIIYNGDTTGVEDFYEEMDYSHIGIRIEKFSGTYRAQVTHTEEHDKLKLTFDSTVYSGNLGIIVIDPNGNLLFDISVHAFISVTIDDCIEGEYTVIIGGESADFSLSIDREFIE